MTSHPTSSGVHAVGSTGATEIKDLKVTIARSITLNEADLSVLTKMRRDELFLLAGIAYVDGHRIGPLAESKAALLNSHPDEVRKIGEGQ